MAGALALGPEFLARPAEERDVPGFNSFIESGLVHIANHQDAAGSGVLDYSGNQAVLLIEVELQRHQNCVL